MTDSAPDQKTPASDLAETIAFLNASPHYIEGLSEENLRVMFKALPKPVGRLIFNLAALEWSDAIDLMQKRGGVGDRQGLESIRPLVERFKPLASTLFASIKEKAELRKEYAGIGAIRPRYLFELELGTPILHLQFLNKDEKLLFESRQTTPDMMGNALGIMVAVAESFELCRDRKLTLQRSVIKHVKDSLTDLLGEVRRIAKALNIPENELIDALSGSNSPERSTVVVEKIVERE